jgi:hypothetical protein
MASDTIISVENLGKMYRLRHGSQRDQRYVALRDVLADKAKGFFRLQRAKRQVPSAGNGSPLSASSSALTPSPLPLVPQFTRRGEPLPLRPYPFALRASRVPCVA